LSSEVGPAEHRAAGILHSLTSDLPMDDYVQPLSLRLHRGNADNIAENQARLRALGIRHVHVVVSDTYGYGAPWPGDDNSFVKWDQVIDEVVEKVRGVDNIAFDIWNEPNGGPVPVMTEFWKPSKTQFFDTWRHGVRRLRSLVPNATVVGPSSNTLAGGWFLGPWGEQWMHDFLTFAHENDVMPDVVSWHALLPSNIESRHGFVLIEEAAKLRAWMEANAIPSRPFSLNEYTPEDAKLKPGTHVGYISAIESVGFQSAALTCWKDDQACGSEFASNCWSGTLDGMLSCPDRRPRATWWLYAAYGGMTGTKVRVDRTDAADAFAVKSTSGARMLVGFHPQSLFFPPSKIFISVTGVPREFLAGSTVFVAVRKISGTTWSPHGEPELAFADRVRVRNGEFILSLNAKSQDVFIVDIPHGSNTTFSLV